MDEQTTETAKQVAQYEEAKEFLRSVSMEERGIDNFFLEIVRTDDTTKVGNLTKDELGLPQIPVRTILELKRDCELVPCMSTMSKQLSKSSEEILATSLSKEGFLINARITQKKSLLDKDKRKERKSLFGKKKEDEE